MLPVQSRNQAAASRVPVSQVWNRTAREVQRVPVAVRDDLDHVRVQQFALFGDGLLERPDLSIGMAERVDEVFQEAGGQRNFIALQAHIDVSRNLAGDGRHAIRTTTKIMSRE